jgi:hypothetical protein
MANHIIKLILGVFFLNLNQLFNIMENTLFDPKNSDSVLLSNMQTMVDSMTILIGTMGYIIGLVFFIMGITGIHNEMKGNSFVEKKENIKLKEEDTKESVVLKKEEVKASVIDFENKELNFLLFEIQSKIKELKNNNGVMKDIESVHMITQTEEKYLYDIHNSYISIPAKKRNQLFKKDNPFDLTKNQLNLLLRGLNDIEDKMINDKIFNQKVNEKFLKEKIATI